MKLFPKWAIFLSFLLLPVLLFSQNIKTYPAPLGEEQVCKYAPQGEKLSQDYEVFVNDKKLDVYTARVQDPPWDKTGLNHGGTYSFVNFDMEGSVKIRIVSLNQSVEKTIIRPSSYGVRPEIINNKELQINIDKPIKLSVEPDGKNHPLLIFANPFEDYIPAKNDPDVIYYGPGIYKPRVIPLKDNQTLYIAGGAVVKGAVVVAGDNVKILGRGILDGSDWEWAMGPCQNTIGIYGDDVVVKGIIIRGSPDWTIVPQHCQNTLIQNVKICNGRVQNDDGINPVNAQNVTIDDCFIRTDDDCIALKGMEYEAGENNNVENITVKNSILWCDRARVTLLGHESRAKYMHNITYENIDIIHFDMVPFLLEPGEDMRLENVTFRDIRLNGNGQEQLIRLRPLINDYMYKQVPGFVNDIHFENISVNGTEGKYSVQLIGGDNEHIINNVKFNNININGNKLNAESPNVEKDSFIKNISFGK